MNKPIYLGQSIFDISKTLMYEFWNGYLKPKYGDKIHLWYTNTDSFLTEVKTEDLNDDIPADVEKWYGTSDCEKDDNRPLLIRMKRKSTRCFKRWIGKKNHDLVLCYYRKNICVCSGWW